MQGTLSAEPRSVAARSRPIDRLILPLALIFGLLAAIFVVAYLRSVEARAIAGPPMRTIVVANRDIAAGERVALPMVGLRAIPESAVVSGSATAVEQVVDQTARYPIAKDEQVATLRLVPRQQVDALSFQIPSGLRGFAIPVSTTTSPAALVAPGDFVDVLATVDSSFVQAQAATNAPSAGAGGQASSAPVAVTVLQNVQVVSVQRSRASGAVPYDPAVRGTPPAEGGVSYLTLAVTPEQAQVLALFSGQSRATVVTLRPFGEARTQPIAPLSAPLQLDMLNRPDILAPARAAASAS